MHWDMKQRTLAVIQLILATILILLYLSANAVVSGQVDRGILICGTGIGIGIAANKIAGIRAALCHDTFSAHACREHNDANILTMGERVIGPGLAKDIVTIWMATDFEGGVMNAVWKRLKPQRS